MPQIFTNLARALLTSSITNVATTINIEPAKADLFPVANTGTGSVPAATDWFKMVLQDATGAYEIVYVRTRTAASGVLSNVIRGQEGTTAAAWAAGTVAGLRITALDVQQSIAAALNSVLLTGNQTVLGTKAFQDTVGLRVENAATQDAIVIKGRAGGTSTRAVTLTPASLAASRTYTLPDAGADAEVVMAAGTQTIAGVKTFTNRLVAEGAYTPPLQPTHSATPTFDCAESNVFEPAALTGNVTSMTMNNPAGGQTVNIRFVQDATGGRTVAVPAGAKIAGNLSTLASTATWLIMTYSARASRWEGAWSQVPA